MRFSSQLGLGPPPPWVPGYRRASRLKNPSGTRSAKVYQACRTSPHSSCEPSEQTSTQSPTIAARFLHPGNTDARSLRQAKGNKNASITFWYAKSQPPKEYKNATRARVWSCSLVYSSATHRHKRTQLNKRTSMRSAVATNLRVAFFDSLRRVSVEASHGH